MRVLDLTLALSMCILQSLWSVHTVANVVKSLCVETHAWAK